MTHPGTAVETRELVALRAEATSIALPLHGRARAASAGNYLSSFRGRGMEFDEARPYQWGDDIRNIDWRVTARTGRPHTKVYREERERPVLVVVDQSESMRFATRVAFKSVVAARLAALLAWAAAEQGDRVGALIAWDNHHRELRPTRGHRSALALCQALGHPPQAPSAAAIPATSTVLERTQRIVLPGSLVAVFSDFRNSGPDIAPHLAQLARRSDVLLVWIYDPIEQTLPDHGHYTLTDGHGFVRLDASDPQVRARHADAFAQQRSELLTVARRYRMTLLEVATTDDLSQRLRAGLASLVHKRAVAKETGGHG
jgi:uncharacterized protein (DUF58 family)